jgi:pilus assembly protein Flp/PilA
MSPISAVAVLKRFRKIDLRESEDGQDLLEYGLLAALIALIAIGAITTVGNTISTVFWDVIAAAMMAAA